MDTRLQQLGELWDPLFFLHVFFILCKDGCYLYTERMHLSLCTLCVCVCFLYLSRPPMQCTFWSLFSPLEHIVWQQEEAPCGGALFYERSYNLWMDISPRPPTPPPRLRQSTNIWLLRGTCVKKKDWNTVQYMAACQRCPYNPAFSPLPPYLSTSRSVCLSDWTSACLC